MSKDNKNTAILSALGSIAQSPMFIYERGAENLLLKYNAFIDSISISEEFAKKALEKNKKDCSVRFYNAKNEIYTGSFASDFSGKIKEDSVAVVPVMGAMMRDDYCDMALNFVAGTRSLEQTIQELDSNQNINGIVLHVVTPGGQAMGNESLANVIKSSNTPVVVYFEMMASAGVYAFQGASEIYAAENDSIWGSIGTYITLVDNKKMLESMGYEVTEIYATESTEKNSEFREAINGNTEPMIQWLDKANKQFIDHVKKVRPSIKDDGKVFKGKIYTAKEAKKIGAIDGISSMQNAMNRARILGKRYKSKKDKDKDKDKDKRNNSLKNNIDMADQEAKQTLWDKFFGAKNETQVEEDFQVLKTQLEESNKNAQNLSAQLEESQSSIESLKSDSKTLEAQNKELSEKLDALTAEFNALKAENEKLLAHNKELGAAMPAETPVDGVQENGRGALDTSERALSPMERAAQIQKQMKENRDKNAQ